MAFLPENTLKNQNAKNELAALTVVANTVMNLDEFMMKE